ncbi:CotD family spore coat protein [Pseudalkalibacillus decolorationis]|uniref:CotD family spore coat protein n=1 Tax=Pseudalkalibacillus decolorationis TaxID=163879 RepID=UPI0035571C83
MCPVVHPPKKCVKHFYHEKIVPHVHPIVEEHVHHNIYQHKHMQPISKKECCTTKHCHTKCPPRPKCGCQSHHHGGHGPMWW